MEQTVQRVEQVAQRVVGAALPATEDSVTKTLERYTATVPSSAYLGVALGAVGLSLLLQVSGRGKWGNYVAQWVPTWLLFGIYNKLVKLEGHDRHDRGDREPRRPAGISNRPLEEEEQQQERVPPRGQTQFD
jgi:hypothetical protein